MANKDDYLKNYREFFEYFAQTMNPNDQLPVKLASYKLLNLEVVGGIIDWTTQYLTQKKCPAGLLAPLIKIIIDETRQACKKQPINFGFNPTDNVYEPLKLMQAVMAKTNEVCLRYRDNSVLCSLPPPSNVYYKTSVYATRNRRRKMEDRHVIIHDLNTMFNIQESSPSSYYAIFDGHAGHDAAAYCSAHLHQYLAESPKFTSNPEDALLDVFCKTDSLFLNKCEVENLSGGTTAVVALVRPKERTLYVAWVGDSQALLVKQGQCLQCVNPHRPCREDERKRIEEAGGFVVLWGTWRVNGQLAVSRALGDPEYKPHVTAVPEVREVSLTGTEDFLILACDGLWDFLSENQAAQEAYLKIIEKPDETGGISEHLVKCARKQGSTDNISVIVVFLRDPHQIAAEAQNWATRNGPHSSLTVKNMEASLDNANNPFTNPNNGTLKNLDLDADDRIDVQKGDSNDELLLNLTDSFKANGTADLARDIFGDDKSNGTKKSTSELHFDDNLGPESNVDVVDDAFSPVDKEKAFVEGLQKNLLEGSIPKSFCEEPKSIDSEGTNNIRLEDSFNPFSNSGSAEGDVDELKELSCERDFLGANRDDTPTPPADTVHDVCGGLEEVVNPAESDSEDEWNYIKGDQAKQDDLTSQSNTVAEALDEDDSMSQLNPNAAEFVPVSPTRSIPSPSCQAIINDNIIAMSPQKPGKIESAVPTEVEFDLEIKSRPSDLEYKNGHGEEDSNDLSATEKIENILNGKNIDEIPEFLPGSTPMKLTSDEFHFGPNATPFIPKALDQSEALSTKAVFGDDTVEEQTLNTSLNESELTNKPTDPMSTSFYAGQSESNPFQDEEDLNKVHQLPDDVEEFLDDKNIIDHGVGKENLDPYIPSLDEGLTDTPLDNDQAAIQTTDLDKLSQDDEKELASPLDEETEICSNVPVTDALPTATAFETNLAEEKSTFDELKFEKELELNEEIQSNTPSPLPKVSAEIPQPDVITSNLLEPQLETSKPEEQLVDVLPDSEPSIDVNKFEIKEEASLVCDFRPQPKSPFGNEQENLEEIINLKQEVDFISGAAPFTEFSDIKSPACEYSGDPDICQLSSENLHLAESQSPIDLLQGERQEEEVTSSVKDDDSYQQEDLSPNKLPLDEPFKLEPDLVPTSQSPLEVEEITDQLNSIEASAPLLDLSSFQQETESIKQEPKPEPSAPLECTLETEPIMEEIKEEIRDEVKEQINEETIEPIVAAPSTIKTELNDEINIKTENVSPQFPESAILSPEESKPFVEEVSKIEPPTEQVPEPVVHVEPPAPAPSVVPTEVTVVPPVVVEPSKSEEKKNLTSASPKKPTPGKVDPKRPLTLKGPTAKPRSAITTTTASAPKPAAATKVPPKTGTAKPAPGALSKTTSTTASKVSPKPKTAVASPKTALSKPAEVKPATKTLVKRSTETTAPKTLTRPATSTIPKTTTVSKTTAPRPATALKSSPSKTATAASSAPKTAAAPKPRVPATSRLNGGVAAKSASTTTATNGKVPSATASRPSTSPRAAAPPAPKPRTITSAPKPRAPISKTVTKSAADVEKEKKENANKMTASRSTTVTKSSTATRTTTTTLKKTEVKSLSDRTGTSKTTTTATSKTTLTKRPGDIKVTSKTKTTKVEKPKENGIAPPAVTEQITPVSNVIDNGIGAETLQKDDSPIDNKLLIETGNAVIEANAAD